MSLRAKVARDSQTYPDFCGWDTGAEKPPYCCSFHWFRLPDGRISGLDVIRSDDSGQLSLRAYLIEPDGAIQGLAYAAPLAAWHPFATAQRPPLDSAKPSLGRGINWIAGALSTSGHQIKRVRFDLNVLPQALARSRAVLWRLNLVHLTATDYLKVHTTGWLEIDETRYSIDGHGSVAVHYGTHLPPYGYCATVFDPTYPEAPSLFLGSVSGEDVRVVGKLLKHVALTYAYGDNGVPQRMRNIGALARNAIPVNCFGRIRLDSIQPFHHQMLGVEAITATANATLHLPLHGDVPLGKVILDYRGALYTDTLAP